MFSLFPSRSVSCLFSGWVERFPDSPPLGEQGTPDTDLLSLSIPAVLHESLINSPLITDSFLTCRGTAWLQKLSLQVCFLEPVTCLGLIICLSHRSSLGFLLTLPSLLRFDRVVYYLHPLALFWSRTPVNLISTRPYVFAFGVLICVRRS